MFYRATYLVSGMDDGGEFENSIEKEFEAEDGEVAEYIAGAKILEIIAVVLGHKLTICSIQVDDIMTIDELTPPPLLRN